MALESGNVRLVFNGEIYNFRALRHELTGLGHTFVSTSDTEVILRGYAQWGEGVVRRLRGMFAFAIWDAGRNRLLLARDRLGQKPLNYAWCGSTLLFGSEIKALLRWPGFERRANLEALPSYFLFRYVPGTDTAFAGVHRLEPAHYLIVDAAGGVTKHRYWDLPPVSAIRERPRQQLHEELLDKLDEAVKIRMISDVPVGAFLSGGVDSSAVVASMALTSSEPVRTFTIGFRDGSIDERDHARAVAERYGTVHTEYMVAPDVSGIVSSLAWFYGEPYADEVSIPTYCISAIARRDVTVALNGDGGDEGFLGYRRHAGSKMGGWFDMVPLPARQAIAALGRLSFLHNGSRGARHVGKALAGASLTPVERYTRWVTYGSDELIGALAAPQSHERLLDHAAQRFAPYFNLGARPEDAAARADLQGLLNENLETRVDIATMANGLEGRSPFLDHELIEWAATVPATDKMRRLDTKTLLKEALLPRVPRDVMYRPKQGLFMDFSFLEDEEDRIRSTILSPTAQQRGLLDPAAVRALLDEFYRGVRRHEASVWMLYVLELWFQMWIDPAEVPLRPPPTPRLDA